jgi:hypothetical protein
MLSSFHGMHFLITEKSLKRSGKPSQSMGIPYRAAQSSDITKDAEHIKEIDIDFILRTLDYIIIYETGRIIICFMDGTRMECNGE